MNGKIKSYVAPCVDVYEIVGTGVLCTSGSTQNYVNNQDVTEEWFTDNN